MAAIGVLLESRTGLLALRRTLPRGGAKIATCRGIAALRRLLDTRLIDAIVVAPYAGWLEALTDLRARLPAIPVIAFAPFRPDDGELLLTCHRLAVAAVAVEGVDDAVVGDVVARYSPTAARRAVLADAPRTLCLTESLQLAAWNARVNEGERPIRTTVLAERL